MGWQFVPIVENITRQSTLGAPIAGRKSRIKSVSIVGILIWDIQETLRFVQCAVENSQKNSSKMGVRGRE